MEQHTLVSVSITESCRPEQKAATDGSLHFSASHCCCRPRALGLVWTCILMAVDQLQLWESLCQSVNIEDPFTSRNKRTAGTGSTQPRCHGDSHGAQLAWCSQRSGGEEGDTGQDRGRSTGPGAARRRMGCRCGGRSPLAFRPGPWSCLGPRGSPGGQGGAGGRKGQSHVYGALKSHDQGRWQHQRLWTQSCRVLIHCCCCRCWRRERETFRTRGTCGAKARRSVFCSS